MTPVGAAIALIAGLFIAGTVAATAAYAQAAPKSFKVASVEATTVKLSWTRNASPANFYRVKYSTSSAMTSPKYQTVQSTATTPSMTIIGLKNNTRYYFQVRALKLSGSTETGLSDYTKPAISTTTDLYYYSPPGSLRVDEIYSDKLDVSWNVVPNAHSYEIAVTGKPTRNFVDTSTMKRVGTAITGLTPNTAYTIKVRALQQQGQALTDWRTITGRTSAIEDGVNISTLPPSSLSVVDVANKRISLSWDPVDGATGYRIQWWKGGVGDDSDVRYYSMTAAQVGASAPHITFEPNLLANQGGGANLALAAKTKYSFRISALGDGTETRISNYSSTRSDPVIATTSNYPKAAPADLTASSPGTNSVQLSWASVEGATGYRVTWSTSSSSRGDCPTKCAITPTAATSYQLTGLAPNTTYYVWVSTVQNDGTKDVTISDYQLSPQTFKTLPEVAAPDSIWQDEYHSETGIKAHWSAVAGATSYEYRWSRRSDMGSPSAVKSTSTPTATITGLAKDQIHYFQVRAKAGSKTGSWSDPVALKTPVNYGAARGVLQGPNRGTATIVAYNASGAQVSSAKVDPATGEFLVKDLRPSAGPYKFQALQSDNVAATSPWYKAGSAAGVSYRTQAGTFTVPDWSNDATTTLVLPTVTPPAGRSISGTLTAERASCLANVRVVVKSNSSGVSTGEVLADETLAGSGGTSRTFTIRGIPKGDPVSVWVFGSCADASASVAASSADQNVSITVYHPDDITIPKSIGGIVASDITTSDATISWNTVPTATRYRVYIRTTNSFPGTCEPNCWEVVPSVSGSKASIQLSSVLTPAASQNYYVKISAINASGKTITSWQSSAYSFKTATGPTPDIPDYVEGIAASDITTSDATISWNAVPTATKYRVYVRTTNSFPGTCEPNCWTVVPTASGSKRSIKLSSVLVPQEGIRYYVKISAINASGKTITGWQPSAYSFTMGGTPPPTIPAYIEGIAASDITTSNAELSWDAVPTATKYRLYIRTTNSFPSKCEPDCWEKTATVSGSTASIALSSVLTPTEGTRYYVKISAINAAGKTITGWQPSAYSFKLDGTAPTIPSWVEEINATDLTLSDATLSWNVVPTATKYRVYARTTNSFPSKCEPNCWVVDPQESGSAASIKLSSILTPGIARAYYVKISAINAAGKTITGWQPSAFSFRLATDGLEAQDVTASNATLRWNVVPGAAKYRVYVRTSADFPYNCEPDCWLISPSVSGSKASIKLGALSPDLTPVAGRTYYVKISAVDANNKLLTGWQDQPLHFTLASS